MQQLVNKLINNGADINYLDDEFLYGEENDQNYSQYCESEYSLNSEIDNKECYTPLERYLMEGKPTKIVVQ
jgi:hypothetical protein